MKEGVTGSENKTGGPLNHDSKVHESLSITLNGG